MSVTGLIIQEVRDLLNRIDATPDEQPQVLADYIVRMENFIVPLGFVVQPAPPDVKAYAAEMYLWATANRVPSTVTLDAE